uniref:CLASP_N domain-containing protein n=1 Tax=Panagrellus redivivus TaxID=6233 RepID=A0A7E4ZRV2_PANRE
MGSRLRSAVVPVGSGISEADFKEVFNKIKPATFTTRQAFLNQVSELNNQLVNPNKDWNSKASLLVELRSLAKCVAPDALEWLAENSNTWERCLIEGPKELRSTLNKEYCMTICLFTMLLGPRMIRQVELMFQNLMNLIQNSAKIMSLSGSVTSEFIAKYVEHPKVITLLAGYVTNKAHQIRKNVVNMLLIILQNWSNEHLNQNIKTIKEIVRSGLCDADTQVRAASRSLYSAFNEKYPELANEIFETLDASRQRALAGERSAASSTHSVAHENGSMGFQNRLPHSAHSGYLANRSRSDVNFRRPGFSALRSKMSTVDAPRSHSPPLVTPQKRRNGVGLPSATPNIRPLAHSVKATPSATPKPMLRSTAPASAKAAPTARPGLLRSAGSDVNGRKPESTLRNPSACRSPPYSSHAEPNTASSAVLRPAIWGTSKYMRPNIAPPKVNHKVNPAPFNGNNTHSLDFTDARTNPVAQPSLADKLQRIMEQLGPGNVDYSQPAKTIEVVKEFQQIILSNSLSGEEIDKHYNAFFYFTTQLLRETAAPNTLKVAVLETFRDLLNKEPVIIDQKIELILFRLLECQDHGDAMLTRACEECCTVIVKYTSVQRCVSLLMPVIGNSDSSAMSIAAALKLLKYKVNETDLEGAKYLLNETKERINDAYTHTDSVVRRAVVIYFVALSEHLGVETLRPHLSVGVFKLLEVYREKMSRPNRSR